MPSALISGSLYICKHNTEIHQRIVVSPARQCVSILPESNLRPLHFTSLILKKTKSFTLRIRPVQFCVPRKVRATQVRDECDQGVEVDEEAVPIALPFQEYLLANWKICFTNYFHGMAVRLGKNSRNIFGWRGNIFE